VASMIVYLDGSYMREADARVPLLDGGYLYGDGVFETLRLYGGLPYDLAGHLSRMTDQLQRLEIPWRPRLGEVAAIVADLVRHNGLAGADARFRLTVSRGRRAGELLPLDDLDTLRPTISAMVFPLPAALAEWQRDGIRVKAMQAAYARGNFPGLKTLNYLPTALALRAAHREGCREALLVDRRGRVLEGAASNVFILNGGTLRTPPLRLGVLGGRTRAIVMRIAADRGLDCVEESFTVGDLVTSDEAFFSGSVKEIVPVTAVDEVRVGDGAPGPVVAALQKDYRRAVLDALGGGD